MAKTETIVATWTVVPTAAPQPVKHCPTCAATHPFSSSGRVRLNANGKRLDAWLIYKCTACDQTWNRPLLDRKPVSQITPAEMDAMQHSAPGWVRTHEFNLIDLKRHAPNLHHPSEVSIEKRIHDTAPQSWSEIRLTLKPEWPTGCRVDKVLCSGWGLSRSALQKMTKSSALTVHPDARNAFKKPLRQALGVQVTASNLTGDMRQHILQRLGSQDG